jgi:predicted MFS family arabinose efflux permease
MTALVYGFVRAASDGWTDRGTLGSFAAGVLMLAAFGLTERRAEQPITPLHLFSSRQRTGAYAARVLVTGAMFSTFFFLTQFLQGVAGYSALQAGVAFLPMTLVMFTMGRLVPLLTPRVGSSRLLTGGLFLAVIGLTWLSRVSDGMHYFPGIAVPLALLGVGIGMAFTPLTAAGIAGVAPADAGAASGLVNVAQQLGGSLGLGILITVFASAARSAAQHPVAGASAHAEASRVLAHGVATSLTGSAVLLTLALGVVLFVMRRPAPAVATAPAQTAPGRVLGRS